MIILTKLDGHLVAVNEDLIVFAEKTPDTVLTMTAGQRLMVRETVEQVIERITAFRLKTTVPIAPEGVMPHG